MAETISCTNITLGSGTSREKTFLACQTLTNKGGKKEVKKDS